MTQTNGFHPSTKVNFDSLHLSSASQLLERSSHSEEEWNKVNYRWAENAETNPLAVVYPGSVEDVQAVVKFAVKEGVRLAIKGGGHANWDCNGINDGLTVDMSRINAVTVSEDKKSVIVGGGARWEHVFPVTDAANVAVVGGGVGNVGIGGFLSGGGYSWLTGLYGLGCDNVLAAQVVLASGEVVRCDAKQEAELFWSIRGGSSNFGAITEFTIAAYPHPGPALSGVLVYIEPQLQTVYEAAKHFIDTRHPSQSFVLMFARSPHDASPSIVVPPYVPGATKEEVAADPAFGGFFKAKPVADHTYIAPGFDGISHGADAILLGGPRRKRASCVLFEIAMFHNQEMLNSTWELYKKASADLPGAQLMFEMHHPDKTASFAHDSVAYHAAGRRRHAYTLLVCQYDGAENDERAAAYIKAMAEHLRKEQIRVCGNDLNYNGNGVEEHEPIEMIYGNHLPRLRENKRRFDPDGVFRRWHFIPAAATPV